MAQVLITNGNTLTPADVLRNLANTRADGLMSCEGILRNPLLFAQARRVSEERERNGEAWLMASGLRALSATVASQKTFEFGRRPLSFGAGDP